MGSQVHILESGKITAESLKAYLDRHPEIEKKLTGRNSKVDSKSPACTFLTTDDPTKFKTFVEKHFGMKIRMPEKVELSRIR